MTLATTATVQQPLRLPTHGSGGAGPLDSAVQRAKGLSRRQRLLVSAGVVGGLMAIAGLTQDPKLMAYLSVFGLSVATNAILFLPSGRGAIIIAAAMVLNPFAVAVLTGVGGAIGELTGYAVGRSSRAVGKRAFLPARLDRYVRAYTGPRILVFSIVPNPFVDVIGIIAGRNGYSVGRFLVYSIVGKVVQSIVLVYAALWNLSLIAGWLNL